MKRSSVRIRARLRSPTARPSAYGIFQSVNGPSYLDRAWARASESFSIQAANVYRASRVTASAACGLFLAGAVASDTVLAGFFLGWCAFALAGTAPTAAPCRDPGRDVRRDVPMRPGTALS